MICANVTTGAKMGRLGSGFRKSINSYTVLVEITVTLVEAGDHRANPALILYNDNGNAYDYRLDIVYLVPEDSGS